MLRTVSFVFYSLSDTTSPRVQMVVINAQILKLKPYTGKVLITFPGIFFTNFQVTKEQVKNIIFLKFYKNLEGGKYWEENV